MAALIQFGRECLQNLLTDMGTIMEQFEALRLSIIFVVALTTLTLILLFLAYKILDRLIRIPWISDIEGKYILITGSGTGFGRHLVESLLGRGCNVIATCHTEEHKLEIETALGCKQLHTLILDVSKPDSIKKAYLKVQDFLPDGKGLWAIVNNAGVCGPIGPMAWMNRQDFQRVLEVNSLGMIDVTLTFMPLVKQCQGRIINMASAVGRLGLPNSGAYCISKYVVEGFSDVLRRELQLFGVGVSIIEPGSHRTNLIESKLVTKHALDLWDRQPDKIRAEYGEDFFIKTLNIGTTGLQITSRKSLQPVVRTYEHAIFSRLPRSRYVVGVDGHLYVTASYFPDWVVDFAFWLIQPTPAIIKKVFSNFKNKCK